MAHDSPLPPWVAGVEHRMHELDPELDDAQIETVLSYGEARTFADGDMLWRAGQRNAGFFLVLDGQLEIVDKAGSADEHVIITHRRGHYGGEVVTMAGQGALVGGRAKGRLEVAALTPEQLRRVIALESHLGETLLTSFVVRRMRMLAEQHGHITVIGDGEHADTARLRTFLGRQGVPYSHVEHDGAAHNLPAVHIGNCSLVRPTIRELAEALGMDARLDADRVYDLAVIGAGPAGLAAAVYGASEGLDVVVLEALVAGGQAGTSSRIENYLGFPSGISGQGLAGRAWLQATRFGATIAPARCVRALHCGRPHGVELDDGESVRAHAVVVASGAVYREPPIEDLDRFSGGGIHYGASFLEAQLCRGKDVAVVGGGNSAGQAAMFLSEHARSVSIIIRGPDLRRSMSEYLVTRIDACANIEVLANTEIDRAIGDDKLRRLRLRDNRDHSCAEREFSHLFVFIGAAPAGDFLPEQIERDARGFVITGADLPRDVLAHSGWHGSRNPHHLETSYAGVFAVGDVRAGSVKRVASAVGEGSVCVQYVHQHLATLESDS